MGSKESEPAGAFVARGFAVAAFNYRLSQHAVFPAQADGRAPPVRAGHPPCSRLPRGNPAPRRTPTLSLPG